MKSSLRVRFYRAACKHFVAKIVQKNRPPKRSSESSRNSLAGVLAVQKLRSGRRIWFHSASVGELESIWNIVMEYVAAFPEASLVLTVFSPSASKAVQRLGEEVTSKNPEAKVVFAGFSPLEGEWLPSLEKFRPEVFVTAKYEAWPELWMSLATCGIPLAVVGASARSSVRWAKRISQWMGSGLPRMELLPFTESDAAELKKVFPEARIQVVGDSRWDRVQARSRSGNPRASGLVRFFENLPRPWGIMGSAWSEDIRWVTSFVKDVPGTLWIVPHQVDEKSVRDILEVLDPTGVKVIRTSTLNGQDNGSLPMGSESEGIVLVDEMGFLSELYSYGDWAYVGGGLGDGVHSTIEPAIHGVPIAIAPKGHEKFTEISVLQESGQLEVILSSQSLRSWILRNSKISPEKRALWKSHAMGRLGASHQIMTLLSRHTA